MDIKKILFFVLIVVITCDCSSLKPVDQNTAQYFYDRGMNFMKRKDYTKAIADFRTIVESYPTSDIVDDAQFMLAEAYFKNEEYITAAFEYERVYEDFRSSNRAPEARYKRALCYYEESPKAALDQENTRLAIDDFNRFIDMYPNHELTKDAQAHIEELQEKLAYKEFRAAELYRKMKKYDAALIYYRYVISDYPRTIWANEARYGIGLVYLKQKNYEKAKETYQLLMSTADREDMKKKAAKKLDSIEKNIEQHKSR